MKKIRLAATVAFLTALSGAANAPAQHNHGGGGGYPSGHTGGHQTQPQAAAVVCPLRVAIFEPVLKDTENGVEIILTAKDARNTAKLREMAALHFASKEDMDKNCPARVGGAKVSIEETAGGVRITITAQSPAAVKTIQAAAAFSCRRETPRTSRVFKTYVCPMGEYQGSKPGKCPKCGMDLVEKK